MKPTIISKTAFFLLLISVCICRADEVALSNSLAAAAPTILAPEKTDATSNAIPVVETNLTKEITAAIPAVVSAPVVNTSSVVSKEPGNFEVSGLDPAKPVEKVDNLQAFQMQLDLGREQRRQKNPALAGRTLVGLLQTNAPLEIKRPAMFELALAAQDDGQFVKAQQIFAQYIHAYPEEPSVPEVLLRQGLVYRQMGVNSLAISKFYAVMSSALKLKLDNMDYYKKLVLQAQIEIADTYYLEGKYDESADFFSRLSKTAALTLNQEQVQFKLIRSLSFLTNHSETAGKAQVFLNVYTNSSEVPEVRFLLASALKKLGRNHDAMKQVLLLLQSQQANVRQNPETWIYWQQKAGNDIANQLYKEGDFLSSLQIYLNLAELDKSPAWQLPVWYQSALVYEQLQQWQKATDMYDQILGRQKELTEATSTPSLVSLLEMAKWRKDYIDWMQKAKLTNTAFQPVPANSTARTAKE